MNISTNRWLSFEKTALEYVVIAAPLREHSHREKGFPPYKDHVCAQWRFDCIAFYGATRRHFLPFCHASLANKQSQSLPVPATWHLEPRNSWNLQQQTLEETYSWLKTVSELMRISRAISSAVPMFTLHFNRSMGVNCFVSRRWWYSLW